MSLAYLRKYTAADVDPCVFAANLRAVESRSSRPMTDLKSKHRKGSTLRLRYADMIMRAVDAADARWRLLAERR